MSTKLWYPGCDETRDELKSGLLSGEVELTVTNPDGSIADHRKEPNSITTFTQWIMWTLLNGAGNTPGARYYDGTKQYPSFYDAWCQYQNNAAVIMVGTNAVGSSAVVTPVPGVASTIGSMAAVVMQWLFGGIALGNYTGTALGTGVSCIPLSAWSSTYSFIHRTLNRPTGPGTVFTASTVHTGPAVNSETISGIAGVSFSVTRTFAAATGTVNAITLVPLALSASGGVNQTVSFDSAAQVAAAFLTAYTEAQGTSRTPNSFVTSLGAAGTPFGSTNSFVCSTFLTLANAVTVATGQNLTITYTISVNLS